MNKVATQRYSVPLRSGLVDLLSFPPLPALRPLLDPRVIRVEDEVSDDVYEIRAELPGIDPEDDIEVTVRDGSLTITAERSRPAQGRGRSEFSYGRLRRTLALPDGADEDGVNAVYDRGILTVSVPLTEERRGEKHIEVVEIVGVEADDQVDADLHDDHVGADLHDDHVGADLHDDHVDADLDEARDQHEHSHQG